MSEQVKLHKRIVALVDSLVMLFSYTRDANEVAIRVDILGSFEKAIDNVLSLIVDCAIFIREHVKRGAIGD